MDKRVSAKAGLWTMDWTVDWNMDQRMDSIMDSRQTRDMGIAGLHVVKASLMLKCLKTSRAITVTMHIVT